MVLHLSLMFQRVPPCDCQSVGTSMLDETIGRSNPDWSTALTIFRRSTWPWGGEDAAVTGADVAADCAAGGTEAGAAGCVFSGVSDGGCGDTVSGTGPASRASGLGRGADASGVSKA